MRPCDEWSSREIFGVRVQSESYIWSRNSRGREKKGGGIVVSALQIELIDLEPRRGFNCYGRCRYREAAAAFLSDVVIKHRARLGSEQTE